MIVRLWMVRRIVLIDVVDVIDMVDMVGVIDMIRRRGSGRRRGAIVEGQGSDVVVMAVRIIIVVISIHIIHIFGGIRIRIGVRIRFGSGRARCAVCVINIVCRVVVVCCVVCCGSGFSNVRIAVLMLRAMKFGRRGRRRGRVVSALARGRGGRREKFYAPQADQHLDSLEAIEDLVFELVHVFEEVLVGGDVPSTELE